MKLALTRKKILGVSVPLSALKSRQSVGSGDFADLALFGVWAKASGLGLIQLLPINDTGAEASPYMALSSQALHPIYISFSWLARSCRIVDPTAALQQRLSGCGRLDYTAVLSLKLRALRQIYRTLAPNQRQSANFYVWIDQNAFWLKPYALFKVLKELKGQTAWRDWGPWRDPSPKEIEEGWKIFQTKCLFYAWLQFQLANQLKTVSNKLQTASIALKGDLPILVNEESADVWAFRDLFDLNRRVGAPPDQYSATGQYWGFPCYNWPAHQQDNYAWQRSRLQAAAHYYNAFRIDHVLGLFRFWCIDKAYTSAIMGYFYPSSPASRAELAKAGLSAVEIKALSRPHITEKEGQKLFGRRFPAIAKELFDEESQEGLYWLKAKCSTDFFIDALDYMPNDKYNLKRILYSVSLLFDGSDSFYFAWNARLAKAWLALSAKQQRALNQLAVAKSAASEALWEECGRQLLTVIKNSSDMLVCAEDLGVVPDRTPKVLLELGILSLRVARWAREWHKEGQPWLKPADYPFLSVSALAVHDTSALRQWWQEEGDREGFLRALGLVKTSAGACLDMQAALNVVQAFAKQSASFLCILQLQDFFALSEKYRAADMRDERVNAPGTVNGQNWGYRMKPYIEDLINDIGFALLLKTTALAR